MIEPGCFGIPSVFSFTSRVCGKCPHFGRCQSQAHAVLQAAPRELVSKLLGEHIAYCRSQNIEIPDNATLEFSQPMPVVKSKVAVRYPLTDDQLSVLVGMKKKASEYLRKLMVRGTDKEILSAAELGQNAFTPEKHRAYHLALEMLLEGGITKPFLTAAYCDQLGWSDQSAKSQTSLIWDLFPSMGLALVQGCALIAGPTVRCKNSSIRYAMKGKK